MHRGRRGGSRILGKGGGGGVDKYIQNGEGGGGGGREGACPLP